MQFSGKLALRIGAVGIAAAAIIVPTSLASAGTGPTLSAAPDTGLSDAQSVAVTGSNFAVSTAYSLVECSGLTGQAACDTTPAHIGTGTTDGTGGFSTNFTVHTGTIGNGKCKPGSTNCYLIATTDPNNPAAAGFTPIDFAPFPSITVTPSKGIHDGNNVKVIGKDFPATKTVAITTCSSKTDTSKCDVGHADVSHTTDGSGSFKAAKFTVHTTASGGMCKPGGKCFLAATTDLVGMGADKSQDAVTKITVVAKTTATKTSAKALKGHVVGKVKAGKKGVKGLKTVLDIRKGGHWKKVATLKTHRGGKFHSAKLTKSGKYEVKTPKQSKGAKVYGKSHSKPVKI